MYVVLNINITDRGNELDGVDWRLSASSAGAFCNHRTAGPSVNVSLSVAGHWWPLSVVI